MAETREPNRLNVLKVKADIDVSDALKGLKALKREVNEAIKALQKLDELNQKFTDVMHKHQEKEEKTNKSFVRLIQKGYEINLIEYSPKGAVLKAQKIAPHNTRFDKIVECPKCKNRANQMILFSDPEDPDLPETETHEFPYIDCPNCGWWVPNE
ncbi:hypothetical protein UM396_14585 [Geobacillus subterraneus]|uniref:hypothetical protein n=1 Tax=Geobacillus subterraneus TaxID=129338 RepID=UPI002AC9DA2E|nr:hypothetical protein [Geobacillus subterraneus]WPZ17809.1 hypothetical protein UM396_14585 [Geobacillus subterraneus]